MRTLVNNFQISVQGFPRPSKQLKIDTFKVGACDMGTAQTAQFQVMGIISGASQHPNDVPLVCEVWWRHMVL